MIGNRTGDRHKGPGNQLKDIALGVRVRDGDRRQLPQETNDGKDFPAVSQFRLRNGLRVRSNPDSTKRTKFHHQVLARHTLESFFSQEVHHSKSERSIGLWWV